MNDGGGRSLLADGREELIGGFHPLLLWRDRQRILADPAIAAEPRPPLANAPMRFALSLGLTPLLLVAWLVSVVVGLLPGTTVTRGGFEFRSETVIEALTPQLPGASHAQLNELRRSLRLSPEARAFATEAASLAFIEPTLAPEERRAALEAWAQRVRASALPRTVQDVVFAHLLDTAHDLRPADELMGSFMRNLAEGGPLMQFLTIASLILSSWLFGQMVRGDARFGRAARSEAFYLYYTTSRLFWFLPAQALAYGLVSYASASGDGGVMRSAQIVSLAVSVATLLYVLAGSRQMARALAGSGVLPPRGGWSIGWRMLVAWGVSTFLVLLGFLLVGAVMGFTAAAMG
jgi:hypothetical protein